MRAAAPLVLTLALLGCRSVEDPAAQRALPPVEIAPLPEGEPALTICVVGDTGTGRADQYAVGESMAARARRGAYDFVLLLGDNFYPAGVESIHDPQWREKFEDVYAQPELQVPFYACLGNHDYKGSIAAQLNYRGARWRMPAPYYSELRALSDGTTVQLFVLDTTPLPTNGEEQLAWLDDELARSTADYKLVCGHYPLWTHCMKPPRTEPQHATQMIDLLHERFVKHGVDLYLSGHDHLLELTKPIDGVRYLISGSGAGADKAYPVLWDEDEVDYASTGGGFCVLRLSKSGLVIEFVRLEGKSEWALTLPPKTPR